MDKFKLVSPFKPTGDQPDTLILAHNKTLAAQLCSEFREFFPENAVEYFVSYYHYIIYKLKNLCI